MLKRLAYELILFWLRSLACYPFTILAGTNFTRAVGLLGCRNFAWDKWGKYIKFVLLLPNCSDFCHGKQGIWTELSHHGMEKNSSGASFPWRITSTFWFWMEECPVCSCHFRSPTHRRWQELLLCNLVNQLLSMSISQKQQVLPFLTALSGQLLSGLCMATQL